MPASPTAGQATRFLWPVQSRIGHSTLPDCSHRVPRAQVLLGTDCPLLDNPQSQSQAPRAAGAPPAPLQTVNLPNYLDISPSESCIEAASSSCLSRNGLAAVTSPCATPVSPRLAHAMLSPALIQPRREQPQLPSEEPALSACINAFWWFCTA